MSTGSIPIAPSASQLFIDALFLDAGYNTAVAMLGSAALGIGAGVVGVFAMLRGRSLMGDALAHSMFPGLCLAFLLGTAMGWNARALPLLMAGASVTGILGALCVRALRIVRRFTEDLSMAIVLAVFFGFGAVLLNIIISTPTGNQAGLSGLLLGQAASMLLRDAQLIGLLAAVCVAVCVVLFKELRLLCFDDRFARALGLPVRALDLLLMGLILTVTVIGLQAVGLVLVVALLIIPAATARFWSMRLSTICLLAAIIGGLSGYLGAGLSRALAGVPTGATIVLVAGGMFLFSAIVSPRRGLLGVLQRRASMRLKIATDHALRHAYEASPSQSTSGYAVPPTGPLIGWIMRRRGLAAGPREARTLTPKGIETARRLTEAHELWERYLEIYAGLGAERVHNPADLVEHVLSPQLTEALRARVEQAAPPTENAR